MPALQHLGPLHPPEVGMCTLGFLGNSKILKSSLALQLLCFKILTNHPHLQLLAKSCAPLIKLLALLA
jgi:hypothetical protein